MTRQHSRCLPPLSAWQPEVLRLTAFPTPDAEVDHSAWWTELVGELPESRLSLPRKGVQKEEGLFEGTRLLLSVQLSRIDWVLAPTDSLDKEIASFSTTGTFPDSLEVFLRLARRWLEFETCPSLQRLAFGSTLLQPVEDRQAGYRQLGGYLGSVQLDPEGMSDFLFRINRPRPSVSGVAGLRINRLTSWSVAALRRTKLSITPSSGTFSHGREMFACRLELDINTAPDFQAALPRMQLREVLEELVSLGKEIAREGDIP